ncbi:MAG: rod shape-determining protein RodA [Methylacidiphilales bacterium]|nr:rod shape-determining protein RodA [Candidatus Methylacidiphilales bacterium]
MIILCVVLLASFSLIIVIPNIENNYFMVVTKIFQLSIAIILVFLFSIIPFHMILSLVPISYIIVVSSLVYVEFFGLVGKGATRWIQIGNLSGQPSEFLKAMIPLIFSYYFASRPLRVTGLDIIRLSFLILTPVILIALQPDFGTAIFIVLVTVGCMFLSGIKHRYLIGGLLTSVVTFPLLWIFYLSEYQKQRIKVFLNIDSDPLGSGYHILQSKIAIGSGGILGLGLGNGTQTQLNYIPEFHTDFIFATFCEDFGLVGALVLITVYIQLIVRLIIATNTIENNSERVFVGGVAVVLLLSCFFNIGMVIGILPVVGMPLPWMSYGGSSLISTASIIGIAMGIVAGYRRGRVATY